MSVASHAIGRGIALGAVAAAAIGVLAAGGDSLTTAATAPTERASVDNGVIVVEDGLDPVRTDELNVAAAASFGEISAPGAVMALRTPEGTWVATIGYQDWDETIPQAADLNTRVGSVTKTFTVTLLLQLAEQGLL